MTAISVYDGGLALAREMLWSPDDVDGKKEVVKFEEFWKVCTVSGLTYYDRKIKELWKGFQMFGVAKPVNQYNALIFDLEKFRVMMATHFPEWRRQ